MSFQPTVTTALFLFRRRSHKSMFRLIFFRKFLSAFQQWNSSWLIMTRFSFCLFASRRETNFAANTMHVQFFFHFSFNIMWHEHLQILPHWTLYGQSGADVHELQNSCYHCHLHPWTWKVVQIWNYFLWKLFQIWNTNATRDVTNGANSFSHRPAEASEKVRQTFYLVWNWVSRKHAAP